MSDGFSGFLSYSRHNDRRKDVSKFRRSLINALSEMAGEDVEIFQDTETLRTGENWQKRIFDQIEQSAFFVCIVSQAFIKSKMCRNEFHHAKRHNLKIFPVYWMQSELFENQRAFKEYSVELPIHHRSVIREIKSFQYLDFRKLRLREPKRVTYRNSVEKLAREIIEH